MRHFVVDNQRKLHYLLPSCQLLKNKVLVLRGVSKHDPIVTEDVAIFTSDCSILLRNLRFGIEFAFKVEGRAWTTFGTGVLGFYQALFRQLQMTLSMPNIVHVRILYRNEKEE